MSETLKLIENMKEIQDQLNTEFVGSNWKEQELDWQRYIRVEAYELMDHHNTFKHWKKPNPNLAQAKIELLDIWHFMLSDLLVAEHYTPADIYHNKYIIVDAEETSNWFNVGYYETNYEEWNINDIIDQFVFCSYGDPSEQWAWFGALHGSLGIDIQWAAANYVGKVALNKLRIEMGQQEGNYIKHWGPEKLEDNVFLEELFNANVEPSVDVYLNLLREKYIMLNKG